jgi:hypothetical protein
MQRPDFVRKTKRSGTGHEDIGYSYVVIRRGARPVFGAGEPKLGRLGQVGRRGLEKDLARLQQVPPSELVAGSDDVHFRTETPEDIENSAHINEVLDALDPEGSTESVRNALRREAYVWPRLIFPPLKKSGHIILDACTPQGGCLPQPTCARADSKTRGCRQNYAHNNTQIAGQAAIL